MPVDMKTKTRAILAERWPKSVYLFDKMSQKADVCKAYATEFSEYLESGGTLTLRSLVTEWRVMSQDAIGGYSLEFFGDICAIDSAHFHALTTYEGATTNGNQ